MQRFETVCAYFKAMMNISVDEDVKLFFFP